MSFERRQLMGLGVQETGGGKKVRSKNRQNPFPKPPGTNSKRKNAIRRSEMSRRDSIIVTLIGQTFGALCGRGREEGKQTKKGVEP